MSEDLSVLLAKLNSLSADLDRTQIIHMDPAGPVHVPPPVHRHTCTHKEVSDEKSQEILHEITMLGMCKINMLAWCRWLDNTINGRSLEYPLLNMHLQGVYSVERQTVLTLIYKIPYKYDLLHEKYVANASQNKLYYCTQYTTFSNDSRDVHCRVTIYDDVRNVLNEMSVWKMRFRQALDSTQQVEYDRMYNEAKQSAESWMSVAAPRIGTQALAYSRARQLSTHRNAFRG